MGGDNPLLTDKAKQQDQAKRAADYNKGLRELRKQAEQKAAAPEQRPGMPVDKAGALSPEKQRKFEDQPAARDARATPANVGDRIVASAHKLKNDGINGKQIEEKPTKSLDWYNGLDKTTRFKHHRGDNRSDGLSELWKAAGRADQHGRNWCGCFVNVALKEAGIADRALLSSVFSTGGALSYARKNPDRMIDLKGKTAGECKAILSGEGTVRPGDIVVFARRGHVGLVQSVDTTTGELRTIEGNTWGKDGIARVLEKRYTPDKLTDAVLIRAEPQAAGGPPNQPRARAGAAARDAGNARSVPLDAGSRDPALRSDGQKGLESPAASGAPRPPSDAGTRAADAGVRTERTQGRDIGPDADGAAPPDAGVAPEASRRDSKLSLKDRSTPGGAGGGTDAGGQPDAGPPAGGGSRDAGVRPDAGTRADAPGVLSSGDRRRDAILRQQPGVFRVADNPKASGREPIYELKAMSQVNRYSSELRDACRSHGYEGLPETMTIVKDGQEGFDPDLVRAVMWVETTHGYYDKLVEGTSLQKSIQPMNINVNYWAGLGYTREQLREPATNIRAGVRLLSELWARTENPTVAKVATLYNNLSAGKVSDYGARVEAVYRTKPWRK